MDAQGEETVKIRPRPALLMRIDMAHRLLSIAPFPDHFKVKALTGALDGVAAETVEDIRDGLDRLKVSEFDAVLVCFPMPEWKPEEVLEEVQRINTLLPVIVYDAGATLAEAVRLTKLGAFQYLGPDATGSGLRSAIGAAAAHHQIRRSSLYDPARSREPWRRFLVGESRAMRNVTQIIRLIGARRSTVLISGETGTGKEVAARAIHQRSPRRGGPFVAVNCGAIPENLLESELFGHVKGAFTDAKEMKKGLFEVADGGTIFLDEIGDMNLILQAKLLRVLEEMNFRRLGGIKDIDVDLRVIASSNKDLKEEMSEGRFRSDLYYRVNVVSLDIPSLRERGDDILLLADYFLGRYNKEFGKEIKGFSPEAASLLLNYTWPGNIRELKNFIERLMILHPEPVISAAAVSSFLSSGSMVAAKGNNEIRKVLETGDYRRAKKEFERLFISAALKKHANNVALTAREIGMERSHLHKKIKTLDISIA